MNTMTWSEWIVEAGIVSVEQMEDAVRLTRLRQMSLPDALLSFHYADRWAITRALAFQYGYPLFDFYTTRIPETVIRTVPDILVRDFLMCPVSVDGPILWYATPHITDADRCDRVRYILNRDARPMWAPAEWLCQADREYYSVCTVSKCGAGLVWSRYGDDGWLLVAGNRYREFAESRLTGHRD